MIMKEFCIFLGGIVQDGKEGILFPIEDDFPSSLFCQRSYLLVEVKLGPFFREWKVVLKNGLKDGHMHIVQFPLPPNTQSEQTPWLGQTR